MPVVKWFVTGMVALVVFLAGQPFWIPPAFAASTVDTFTFVSVDHEERYRGLIAEIRCPKCQNVNIAGSDAPIAKDLRITVHRLLSEGRSDDEILTFLQERYGDFVLYNPPLRSNTLLLWLVPLFGFLVIVAVVLRMARRAPEVSELSAADAERLQGLLAQTQNKAPRCARSLQRGSLRRLRTGARRRSHAGSGR